MAKQEANFAPVRFSTADLPAGDRLGILREEFGRQIVRIDFAPLGDRPLEAETTMRRLPGLRLGTFNAPGLELARTTELIADNDDVFCFLMESGGTSIASLRGRSVTLRRGDAVLLYSMEPVTTTHLDTQLVSATVPRAALAPLVANVEDATIRVVPAGTEALRLLPTYLRAVREELALASPELRHLAVTHVHDLIALAVGATRAGAALAEGRGLRAARLAAVKADIIAYLGRRDLSMAFISARQGLSARHIRRLFEAEDTSFSNFVLEQRLTQARRMLADPRHAEWTISTIAFQCGFGDLSYFNRTFRRRFGAAPSDVRSESDAQG